MAKKSVEIFFWQPYILFEISHQRTVFGVAFIIDNLYVICTSSYFSISAIDEEIIDAVTHISIQAWYCQMGHLGYQNILQLVQVANEINVKDSISRKICGDHMRE